MTLSVKSSSAVSRLLLAGGFAACLGASVAEAADPKTQPKPQAPAAVAPAAAVPAAQRPASASTPTSSGETLARVGATELKDSDIRNAVNSLGPRERAALAEDPAALSQFVRVLLVNQLVLKEAVAKQWDQQPANAALLQRVRESAVIEAYLQSVSKPAEDFPAEADIRKAYEANKGALQVPRQYQLAQVYVAVPKEGDAAAKEKAKQKIDGVFAKLKAPNADFGAIARADSDAKQTAGGGGEIGWVTEAQLRPEVRPLVLALVKGGITDPIMVDDGWQIIKLLDTKEPHVRAFEEVRDALAQRMREEQAAVNRRAFIGGLLKQDAPVINELALSKLLSSGTGSASQ